MKLLTKNTDYAVRTLIHLSGAGDRFVSAKEISGTLKIPYQFLRSILRKVKQGGFVESKEGVMGGVRLRKDPSAIKIIDLITLFRGEVKLSECMFRKKLCPDRDQCVLREEIKRIEKILEKEFGKLTIGKLFNKLKSKTRDN